MAKIFKGTQSAWNKFRKPVVNVAAPFVGMAVGAKTINTQVAQATKNLKSISGGNVLSLTGVHGNGFRLRVM